IPRAKSAIHACDVLRTRYMDCRSQGAPTVGAAARWRGVGTLMLDLDPGRDYVPPSTDGHAPEVRTRQHADFVARAAVGPSGEGTVALRRPGRRDAFPSSDAAR